MNASVNFFSLILVLFLSLGSNIEKASAARPDRKKGICFYLTSKHLTPRQFAKGYQSEKRENARLFEKSQRKMAHKQHGLNFFQFRSEHHLAANPSHF
jgi:hypothetical protein